MNQHLIALNMPDAFSNCDREPIHTPSLIQPHGMLLVARVVDSRLIYTSQNAPQFLGVTPDFIFGKTLLELLGPEAIALIDKALGDQQNVLVTVRTLSFPLCPERCFEVSAHRTGDLLCVELEFASSEARWDLLAAQLMDATRALSAPTTLRDLCVAIPSVIRKLTGYDRVIVYRFHADGHGEVVGDDKQSEMEPFLGLHYPVTDIPLQARKLYLQQRIRTIVDVDSVPVLLLSNRELIQDQPLNMTFCSLRSTSPIHLEYMRIMGVGASLGISLVSSGELWGLIIGHHRTSKYLQPELRALCDLLGQLISLLIGTVQQADAAADDRAKKSLLDLISISIERNLLVDNGFADNAQPLLTLVNADGAVSRLGGHLTLLGNTPDVDESTALFDALYTRLNHETVFTDTVGTLLPAFAHLASHASGALLIPLQEPSDGILWLRKEVIKTVRWAGPMDASRQRFETSSRISPRRSFTVWEQIQHGRSLPWLPAEIEVALGVQRSAIRVSRLRSNINHVQLHTDQLTGLGNRLMLLERIVKWRAKGPQAPAALLFLDLDCFRIINERYGHQVGDELLRRVGARLGFTVNWKHLVARLGGDEFAMFCENTTLSEAEQLSSSILESLTEPFEIMGIALSTTASIGIAPVSQVFETNASDPLRVADSAMYVAKHKGGNQFSIVESREQAEVLRATIAEEELARVLAAIELATSHARFNSLLESTSDNIITIGYDWNLLYANQRATANTPDFRIGTSYWTCFPSVLGTSIELYLRAAMIDRSEQHFEMFFAPYKRWYRTKAFPVDEGISLFFSDITEYKHNEEQLACVHVLREKRIEALTHMAAGLAHEISNPLAIINGLAGELALLSKTETLVSSHEVSFACERIVKTAYRASNILHGLRGFAREAAQTSMEMASIYEVVEQCTELQQERLERHEVDLTTVIDPEIPDFLCREVQIGQILTNLVNNAFDAITQSDVTERWIAISVKFSQNQINVDVTDSGPGIQDHFKAHLMEPFFTTKELGLGMGVGLSLSRAIAQDHGGTLALLESSENTTFRLILPTGTKIAEYPSPPLLAGVPR